MKTILSRFARWLRKDVHPVCTTVNDVLTKNDVLSIVDALNKDVDEVEYLVVYYGLKNGKDAYRCTQMAESQLVYLLEQFKLQLMNGEFGGAE